jgi:hypothetical protein
MVKATRGRITAIVLSLLLAVTVRAAAQDPLVRVEGRVAWIAGQTLVMAPDGRSSIGVDLSQLPQDQHAKLREGERIVVTGAVTNDRSKLVAYAVERPGS